MLCRAFVVTCAVAAAAACNSSTSSNVPATGTNADANRTSAADTARTDQQAKADAHAPIAIDGCLQKGSGGTYLLTRINQPAHKDVGSSGASTNAVEQEQLWLARNEYRIDPQHDVKVDDLIGKQVHVVGTLADAADLPTASEQADRDRRDQPAATSGRADRDAGNAKGADIKQGDLAKIDATAVSMTAQSCGSNAAAPKPKQ
jgi:hypothetical protein